MAYDNQDKCLECGKPILPMPEDADYEELICDFCYDETEKQILKQLIAATIFDYEWQYINDRPHEEVCNTIAEIILNNFSVS